MHNQHIIKDETAQDKDAIFNIHYTAFKDHPLHQPGAEPFEQHITDRLREEGALALSLVAHYEGKPVGHIAASPVAVGRALSGWYIVGPLGVLPEYRNKKIGNCLMLEAIKRLQEKGALGMVLIGEPEYYNHFGFISWQMLTYPGVPKHYVLGLPFGDEEPHGEIVPHPALKLPRNAIPGEEPSDAHFF